MNEILDHWHAAFCWGGQEQRPFDKLTKCGYKIFFPRWVQQQRIFGRPREMTRPMHSGCLFVAFDGGDAEEWHNVRKCFGDLFGRFVGGEFPTKIKDSAFDTLRLLYGADATGLMPMEPKLHREEPGIQAGDSVRILGALSIDGTDVETIGRITWSDRDGARFTYLFFGRELEGYAPHSARMLEKVERLQSPQYGRAKNKVYAAM